MWHFGKIPNFSFSTLMLNIKVIQRMSQWENPEDKWTLGETHQKTGTKTFTYGLLLVCCHQKLCICVHDVSLVVRSCFSKAAQACSTNLWANDVFKNSKAPQYRCCKPNTDMTDESEHLPPSPSTVIRQKWCLHWWIKGMTARGRFAGTAYPEAEDVLPVQQSFVGGPVVAGSQFGGTNRDALHSLASLTSWVARIRKRDWPSVQSQGGFFCALTSITSIGDRSTLLRKWEVQIPRGHSHF